MRRISLPLLLFAALAPAGCSRAPAELAPAHGRVFFRDAPLAGGTIVFTPDAQRGGRGPQAVAEIGADGRFVLHTAGKKGAVPGWHLVTVATSPDAPVRLPGRYRDPDLSGQRAEIKPGQDNTCELRLD